MLGETKYGDTAMNRDMLPHILNDPSVFPFLDLSLWQYFVNIKMVKIFTVQFSPTSFHILSR